MFKIRILTNTFFVLQIVVSILLSSCAKQIEKEEITLLYTNDIHSKIDNFDKLGYLVDSIEKSNKNVFLLSSGDIFSGNPVVDKYNEKGLPIIDLMNKVGFDASSIGNHEFDYGQNVLDQRISDADFDFICANFSSENYS